MITTNDFKTDASGIPTTDWTFFEKLFEANDFTKLDGFQVCRFIYEATYMNYSQKFFQEKIYGHKLEKKIIEKNVEIDNLHGKIAKYEALLESNGIKFQEESKDEA